MFEKFKALLDPKSSRRSGGLGKSLEGFMKHAMISSGVLFTSYISASAVGAFMIPFIMDSVGKYKISKAAVSAPPVNLQGRPNFHSVKKQILERNLFNLDGELPDESSKAEQAAVEKKKEDFDESAPCVPSKLKLSLIGTIFLGIEKNSMATIKEAGFDEADIYKAGDAIIGMDDALIVSIERNRVIINNSGNKECLEIKVAESDRGSLFDENRDNSPAVEEVEGGSVLLQASFVESELGDGFGKIIQSARLVPNTVENRVNGFKIFAIQKNTLLDKIGLQNGDVITQVNDTVMEAEQGFALYQALLDERDITIRVLRQGKTPKTLHARIK
ncbi:MAG: hypothetical protein HRU09_01580 [Oligoflexales bacterium]|nr:hypothetical protein [Oligoflexales bacterium]